MWGSCFQRMVEIKYIELCNVIEMSLPAFRCSTSSAKWRWALWRPFTASAILDVAMSASSSFERFCSLFFVLCKRNHVTASWVFKESMYESYTMATTYMQNFWYIQTTKLTYTNTNKHSCIHAIRCIQAVHLDRCSCRRICMRRDWSRSVARRFLWPLGLACFSSMCTSRHCCRLSDTVATLTTRWHNSNFSNGVWFDLNVRICLNPAPVYQAFYRSLTH